MAAKEIVVIGGGTGTDRLLQGLKNYAARLTAMISTCDASRHGLAGGGPGRPGGAAGSSLLALAADATTTDLLGRLFAYQLTAAGEERTPTFGHLLLSALADITGGAEPALAAAAQVLNVHGRVLPLGLDDSPLVAELHDGGEVLVRTPAELIACAAAGGLRRARLAHPAAAPPAALQVLATADLIVLGPADLYFDLLAPLQLHGLAAAIAESPAVKIFVCNLLTQPYTTAGWPASHFIRRVLEALGGPGRLDYAVVSSEPPVPAARMEKARAGYLPVLLDLQDCLALGLNIIARPLTAPGTSYHDPERLARTILFLGGARAQRRGERPAGPALVPALARPALAPERAGP